MPCTVMEQLESVAQRHGDLPAFQHKIDGQWRATTWSQYRQQVRMVARAFMALGLEPGQGVAIMGENCPQWFVSNTAAIYAGGVPTGIYTTSSEEQCHYIADHSESVIAVLEDSTQLAKFNKIRQKLPKLKAIIMMNGAAQSDYVHSWGDLSQLGAKTDEDDLNCRIQGQSPGDLCTLIYTSGTTADPKGVMLSHDNLTWTARQVVAITECTPHDRLLSYLPLSHIAEQVISLHAPMAAGACAWFCEGLEQLGDNLREVRPTLFIGVPRVWEKIQAKMMAAGAQSSGLKKKIAAWARKTGLKAGYAEQDGRPLPWGHGLANRLVFQKVRQKLGLDACRLQVSTAAPISKHSLEFFLSLGLPLFEVYGMSECSGPATVSLPGSYRTGKTGPAMAGTEIKVAQDGEVCMRGRHVFLGYYKDPAATAEALDGQGWLYSGDVGEIDGQKMLQITDRKKEIIITAGGKNIAPQLVEGKLMSIAGVALAVVVGDRKKYLSALLTLDPENIALQAQDLGSPARTLLEASECPKFQAHIQAGIERINRQLARVQQVKKFKLLGKELSIADGELTPTMKVKRRVVVQRYAQEIEDMYS